MSNIRALYSAVQKDDVAEFMLLLSAHPELEEYNDAFIASWLDEAAGWGSLRIADMLLKRGWTASATPAGRQIHPLWKAKGEHFEMARFLLDNGADPNIERALIGAINSKEALKWVKLFVEYGADVNWCVSIADENSYWATPLSWAKDAEKQEVVDFLLSKGAVMPDDPIANKRSDD